jgi:hypothetical protein
VASAQDGRWTGRADGHRGDVEGRVTAPARRRTTRGRAAGGTARFLGRSFAYGYVVTDHEPDRLVRPEVERPFPMVLRYVLEDDQEGTRVAIDASGSRGRFFGWATPVMTTQVQRSVTTDLARLKHLSGDVSLTRTTPCGRRPVSSRSSA